MTSGSLRAACGAVRVWARLYTWRLPDEARQRRLAEVESDLWESTHDAAELPTGRLAVAIVLRALAGIADDVRWRSEERLGSCRRVAIVGFGGGTVAAAISILAIAQAMRPVDLPTPPAPLALLTATIAAPLPPPPPPPPPPDGTSYRFAPPPPPPPPPGFAASWTSR